MALKIVQLLMQKFDTNRTLADGGGNSFLGT